MSECCRASSMSSGVPAYYKKGKGKGDVWSTAYPRPRACGRESEMLWGSLVPAGGPFFFKNKGPGQLNRNYFIAGRGMMPYHPGQGHTARRALSWSELYATVVYQYTNGFTSCLHAVAPPRKMQIESYKDPGRWRLMSNSFPSRLAIRTKPPMRLVLLCALGPMFW